MTKDFTFCASLQSFHSIRTRSLFTDDFCVNLPALHPQLVDLGLSNVRPLLRLVQLVLHLAELGQVGVGLFLLWGFRGMGG